jgi:signal peptidase I
MEKKRNYPKEPWLAVVLSSCLSGIGQIYSGRTLRGSILILTETTLICLSTWSLLIPKCDILITSGLVLALVAVRIWNLFDAHKCARKTNPEDFETERKQNKDPWLAMFLSDLIPGLGQLYLKKWLRGILFIITGGLMLIVAYKYPLLYISLWGVLATFICYHAYISAPIRREKSNRTILIIAVAILCYHLLSYYKPLFKAYVAEAFRIPTPPYVDFIPPEFRDGSPMKPTLVYRDRVLVRKSKKYVPKRGDVVVFKPPDKYDDNPFIQRVAALSGETIEIKDKTIYIDGQKVQYPAFENIESLPGNLGLEEPYSVPQNHIFLLGDNIANSEDSRFFGSIPMSDVIGKAYKIYWPLSRSGPIE